jgi:ribosomal protein S18 acetylase RimI-like enzyme
MISYIHTTDGLAARHLQGFFTHWMYQPTPATVLRIFQGSSAIVLAFDSDLDRVVGYITAISDGVSCAYIPHLEVLEELRGRGIGSELVRRMLESLQHLYMIDLMCDPELQPFYARLGLRPSTGMIIRNFDRQRCD